ncbi:transcription factor E2F7 [Gastrophryne carolinensis]
MEVAGCLTLRDLVNTKRAPWSDPEREDRSAHKENMYDRFKISPRVQLKGEPIDLSKQKGVTPEKFPITPVKAVDRPLTEPWTPTANLKMLISVASPEIRDREKKKELFRPIENDEPEAIEPDGHQLEVIDDIDDLEKRPSRKQKSLGLLCQKFLARYPSHPISTEKTTISLDEAASSLGVERRRIYDIVNVLESLHLVSRVAKNQYCWHGQHNLNDTLKCLLREGEKQNYGAQIVYFQHKELGIESKDFSLDIPETDCPSAASSSRKDKSLRIMSQKFVMLFLVSATKIITLEVAAKILIEESQDVSDHSKFKTKVRRLYDIANVLTSLGLIKKVHVTEERGRKPAFKWIGPTDFKTGKYQRMGVTAATSSPDSKREAFTADGKQRLFRHSSFNHIQSINSVKRKVCSEPSSPHKGFSESTDAYPSKMGALTNTCRQMTDEGSKLVAPDILSNGNMGPVPFSVVVPVHVDSEYSGRHCTDQESLVSSNGINALTLMPSSNLDHGFLPNQPYMYVPSTSVLMLCGNPPNENTFDLHQREGSSSPISDPCSLPAKRKRTSASDDAPLSLVVPKNSCTATTQNKSPEHYGEEKVTANLQMAGAEPHDLRTKDEALQENVTAAALPQYLYVPSTSGINGFNIFLPASQTSGTLGIPQSQLPHVPCVMVPSTALAAFPFYCSAAVNNTSASSGPGNLNYNLGMASPPHIMFGAPPVVSPPLPEASLEPSPILPTVCKSPMPEKTGSATESPACVVQPISIKAQKSPTPLTPKSIRPVHKDTFFKTPGGSLGISPALARKERSNTRNSSSAQRRLDICSSSE